MIKLFMLFLMVSFGARAQAVMGKKFIFKYEGDDHYRVSFTHSTVTWEGIQGMDMGRSETDLYQSAQIAYGIWMIQWKENDGTFVALTVNLHLNTVVSTGAAGEFHWFRRGRIKEITRH